MPLIMEYIYMVARFIRLLIPAFDFICTPLGITLVLFNLYEYGEIYPKSLIQCFIMRDNLLFYIVVVTCFYVIAVLIRVFLGEPLLNRVEAIVAEEARHAHLIHLLAGRNPDWALLRPYYPGADPEGGGDAIIYTIEETLRVYGRRRANLPDLLAQVEMNFPEVDQPQAIEAAPFQFAPYHAAPEQNEPDQAVQNQVQPYPGGRIRGRRPIRSSPGHIYVSSNHNPPSDQFL